MDTALVTAIGSFAADAVIRRLHAWGLRVVGCDIYPAEWVAESADVDKFFRAPRAVDADAYASFIDETCKNEDVRWVLPLTDVEVDFFNGYRDLCARAGATVCISPARALSLCRDKGRMAAFLERSSSGLRPIPTMALAEARASRPGFPLVLKPAGGRSSLGLYRIRNEQEWQAALASIGDDPRYIAQPLLEGSVVCVDVVRAADGSRCVAIPRRELLRTLNGAGTSVYVFSDKALSAACRLLADELGIVGCVNFELIDVPGDGYRFLECNPRFSGGVGFSCMAAYDCVTNHLRAFAGDALDLPAPYQPQFIARKYEEFVMAVDA